MGKMVIYSKYINQCEMRLLQKNHMFDFIYYNNTIFHSFNHTSILPILSMNTTAEKPVV
jgi:hypothetical protein